MKKLTIEDFTNICNNYIGKSWDPYSINHIGLDFEKRIQKRFDPKLRYRWTSILYRQSFCKYQFVIRIVGQHWDDNMKVLELQAKTHKDVDNIRRVQSFIIKVSDDIDQQLCKFYVLTASKIKQEQKAYEKCAKQDIEIVRFTMKKCDLSAEAAIDRLYYIAQYQGDEIIDAMKGDK